MRNQLNRKSIENTNLKINVLFKNRPISLDSLVGQNEARPLGVRAEAHGVEAKCIFGRRRHGVA